MPRACRLARANRGDDLIHDVHGTAQALQNMSALLGLLQVELGAPADDLILKRQIFLKHLFERHYLGHALVQRQHDNANGVLQLSKAVQLVEHHLGVRLAA